MSVLTKFVAEQFAANPAKTARFLSATCVLVRIRVRRWRGLRKMTGAKVLSDDTEVGEDATTRPSWKLCPDVVRAEFDALGSAVEGLVARYTLDRGSPGRGEMTDDDEAGPALVGNGTYAVDAAVWPALRQKLQIAQDQFGEAAARWCADDGYERIHEELKTQLGEGDYEKVKLLIPDAKTLLRKFSIDVRRAPVQFVSGQDGGGDEELIGIIELAIRVPRETAAAGWDALTNQLINADGTPFVPKTRVDQHGVEKLGCRRVTGRSVAAAARETTTLSLRGGRYIADQFRAVVDALTRELPEDAAAASAVARNLNAKDDEAVRIGKMLHAAAAVARDETDMCLGFAAARRGD